MLGERLHFKFPRFHREQSSRLPVSRWNNSETVAGRIVVFGVDTQALLFEWRRHMFIIASVYVEHAAC